MENFLKFCDLNEMELWLVIRLYIAAILPIILSIYYIIKNKVSYHVALTLITTFLIVSIGWELWLTYGLGGGLPVDDLI